MRKTIIPLTAPSSEQHRTPLQPMTTPSCLQCPATWTPPKGMPYRAVLPTGTPWPPSAWPADRRSQLPEPEPTPAVLGLPSEPARPAWSAATARPAYGPDGRPCVQPRHRRRLVPPRLSAGSRE
jgi:hypothetical protein